MIMNLEHAVRIDPLWYVTADEDYAILVAAAARKLGVARVRHFASGSELQRHQVAASLESADAATAPRLIVVDVAAKDRDVLGFLAWMRREPAIAHVRAVVWTDPGEPALREAVRHCGITGCYDRPLEFERIVDALEFLCGE